MKLWKQIFFHIVYVYCYCFPDMERISPHKLSHHDFLVEVCNDLISDAPASTNKGRKRTFLKRLTGRHFPSGIEPATDSNKAKSTLACYAMSVMCPLVSGTHKVGLVRGQNQGMNVKPAKRPFVWNHDSKDIIP